MDHPSHSTAFLRKNPAPCPVSGKDVSQFGTRPVRRIAGVRIKGGRILDYKDKPECQMCRFYLSMMDKMNVRLPKFGDAAKALEEV